LLKLKDNFLATQFLIKPVFSQYSVIINLLSHFINPTFIIINKSDDNLFVGAFKMT